MDNLKIGDKVNHKTFGKGVLRAIRSGHSCAYGVEFNKAPEAGHDLDGRAITPRGLWVRGDNLSRVGKPSVVKFVMVYDLRSSGDPVETFAKRSALVARIAELAASNDLVRESVRVYEVKRTSVAKITTRVALR